MATQKKDDRFDRMLDGFKDFNMKLGRLRQGKNFLLKAIKDAWKASGQSNFLERSHGLIVRKPIGEINPMQVEVLFDPQEGVLRMRLLNDAGNEITEGNISTLGLDMVLMNPSPAIDAAAKFCEGLGCLESFKGKVARFYPSMTYNL
jgi:hypothetical protein